MDPDFRAIRDGEVIMKMSGLWHVHAHPDQHFVFGRHPEHPRVVVACGFSGHGFKFVSVIGEVLADLAIDGTTSHGIGLFDPIRNASTRQAAATWPLSRSFEH